MTEQFARTPYAVSFQAGDDTFILVTLHVIYGKATDRTPELAGIARWLADWAEREQSWGHNLIALGDFNIDRVGDPNYLAFTSTGLRPAPELDKAPRTIFPGSQDSFYDQIAWFAGETPTPKLSLEYNNRGGFVDFTQFFEETMTRQSLSWRVSDHYPLWVEFNSKRA
jgi:endonuclease/exonuclease/phosphatase family metal-dependent hydrolase